MAAQLEVEQGHGVYAAVSPEHLEVPVPVKHGHVQAQGNAGDVTVAELADGLAFAAARTLEARRSQ